MTLPQCHDQEVEPPEFKPRSAKGPPLSQHAVSPLEEEKDLALKPGQSVGAEGMVGPGSGLAIIWCVLHVDLHGFRVSQVAVDPDLQE